MSMRMMSVLAAAAAMQWLGGCGPTAKGVAYRAEARQRLATVSANVTYEQAKQAFESGQFDRALRDINSAIERYPDMAAYYVLQGRIHLESTRLDQAHVAFKTAQEKDPQSHEAFYYDGIVYQRWSDDEQAYESYLGAFELDKTNVYYLMAAAESLVALGEFDAAEALIAPQLSYFEHNVAITQLRAQIAVLKNDSEKAIGLYAEARMLDPDDMSILEEMIWTQYAVGRFEECRDSIQFLLHKSPEERPDLMRLEAQCLTMMSRSIEARELYVRLIQLQPQDVDLWIEYGSVCWELNDQRRLQECATKLLQMAPERYEGHLMMAMHEKELGNRPEALEHLRKASALAKDSAMPHILLGQMLEEDGGTTEALLAYQNALHADPDSKEARMLFNRLEDSIIVSSVPTDPK